jgi:hypothetical protein
VSGKFEYRCEDSNFGSSPAEGSRAQQKMRLKREFGNNSRAAIVGGIPYNICSSHRIMSGSGSPLLPTEEDEIIDLTDSPPSSPTASRIVISLDEEEEESMDPLLILGEMEEENASEVVHHLGSLTCTVSEAIELSLSILTSYV